MFFTRKPKSGRPLTTYPFQVEPRTGRMGVKLGFCDGCGEPLFIRNMDLQDILGALYSVNQAQQKMFKKMERYTLLWNLFHKPRYSLDGE